MAPADLIGFDLFVFGALKAWEATDPGKPLTQEDRYDYLKRTAAFTGAPGMLTVFHTPSRKEGKPTDASVTWVSEHAGL